MNQPSLFDDVAPPQVVTPSAGLKCSLGEPWTGEHPLCETHAELGCRLFDEAVARGEYDAQGYTPKERRAQQRKRPAA